jgi:hypothetical protein
MTVCVFMVGVVQIVVLWVVTCSLVGGYECFGGTSVVRVEKSSSKMMLKC